MADESSRGSERADERGEGSTDGSGRESNDGFGPEPTDEEVVEAASDAADAVIFETYRQSAVRDYDVTAVFEDGTLDVDVYLNAPDDERDPDTVAEEAALAARRAVDDLFGE